MGAKELPVNMNLFEIIESLDYQKIIGNDRIITDIEIDSRKVRPGGLFCALKGQAVDGHQFVGKAIENGAVAVVCNNAPLEFSDSVTYIEVDDTHEALVNLLTRYYDDVSSQVTLVGVTGTNGKTTVASLLSQLFTLMGYKTGLISTVEIKINEERIPSQLTTPDIVSLHKVINRMVDSGCEYVFMEVSSHAIDQNRIGGLKYDIGVFTNITHDHLDYHKTFKNYINAKKKFFDNLSKSSFALTNIDDVNGEVMLQNTKAKTYNYSLRRMADFKTKIISADINGMHLDINGERVFVGILGEYNAYNLTAVYGVASLLEMESEEILLAISRLKAPKGRFETINGPKGKKVVIDYAHTPDALLKVLKAIKEVNHHGRIITVVGCGGDRDSEKRPKMAAIAVTQSDQVVFTSDNPRWEDPQAIIEDMFRGVPDGAEGKVIEISDRKNAIKTAIRLAHAEDIVLIAGKGHENYQEIKGERKPFDDAEIARLILAHDI